jgi:DnaJ family protein A protein 5
LELHPDRNYGNVDEATKLFAEVQAAYEVLSDPHERAWYDSHRDAILRDDNEAAPDHYEHNVRVTTAEDIMRMFTKFNVHMDYSDSPTGFFSVLRSNFDTLVHEEIAACEWEGLDPLEYPSFGNSKDSYEGVVRPFYAAWSGFATKKTFSWKDVFRYSEAPDRRVRRMMEKENKRLRDDGIREFNDAVRSLVAFVRKRDPRYIPNTQTEAERQRLLRDAAAAQAVRSRAANRAKLDNHVEAEWSKSREPDEEEDDSEEEIEEEQFECVACGKTFKSEKQFETHEKSKKHLKTLQQLRRQMQRENKEFDLGDISGGRPDIPGTVEDEAEEEDRDSADEIGQQAQNEMNGTATSQGDLSDQGADEIAQPSLRPGSTLSASTAEKYSCDEYASRDEVESRLADHVEQLTDATAAASIASDSSTPRKVGKAKEKRARRAAQKKTAAEDLDFTCAACNEGFPSRTKLFTHLKDKGHAHYVPKTTKGSGKGKKR